MARKPNNRLQELRAEVRKAQSSVTRKIRRNEAKGVHIEGTKFDPRRENSKVIRYNIPQLRSYLKDLDMFRARDNQYVSGARGVPLPRKKWRQYERAERAAVEFTRQVFNKYKDVKLDNSGLTVGERQSALVSDSPLRNPAVNSPFQTRRTSQQVTNEKSLQKLIKQAEHRATTAHQREIIKRGRKTVATFLTTANQHEILKDIRKLNDDQFYILWQHSSLPDVASLAYALSQARLSETERRWEAGVIDDSFNEIRSLVKNARKFK